MLVTVVHAAALGQNKGWDPCGCMQYAVCVVAWYHCDVLRFCCLGRRSGMLMWVVCTDTWEPVNDLGCSVREPTLLLASSSMAFLQRLLAANGFWISCKLKKTHRLDEELDWIRRQVRRRQNRYCDYLQSMKVCLRNWWSKQAQPCQLR